MVTLAVGALTSGITASAGYGTAAVVAAKVAVLAASYVDQKYVIPALFGDDKPQEEAEIGNIRLSTTNPGAPRTRVFGRQAFAPGHFLWNLNQRAKLSTTGGGSGKGATAQSSVTEKFADIGVAVADGPIQNIIRCFGDEAPFFGSEFNDDVYGDSRLEFRPNPLTPYNGVTPVDGTLVVTEDSYLIVEGEDDEVSVPPLTESFEVGDIVRLENTGSQGINYGSGVYGGYFRVNFVAARTATAPTYMSLAPLNGQNVNEANRGASSIQAGQPGDPVRIRKMTSGIAGHSYNFSRNEQAASYGRSSGPNPGVPAHIDTAPTITDIGFVSTSIDGVQTDCRRYRFFVSPLERGEGSTTVPTQGGLNSGASTQYYVQGFSSAACNPVLAKSNLFVDSQVLMQGFCWVDGTTSDGSADYFSVANGTDMSRWPVTPSHPAMAGITNGSAVDVAAHPVRAKILKLEDDGQTSNTVYPSNNQPYVVEVAIPVSDLNNHLGDSADSSTAGRTYRMGGGDPTPPYGCHVYGKAVGASTWSGPVDTVGVSGDTSTLNAGSTIATDVRYRMAPGDFDTLEGRTGFTIYNTVEDPASGDAGLTFKYKSDAGTTLGSEQEFEFFNGGDDNENGFSTAYQQGLIDVGDIEAGEEPPAFRGISYVAFKDLNLYQFGNRVPRLRWLVRAAESQSVESVVRQLVETNAPAGTVLPSSFGSMDCVGYSVGAGVSSKEALQPLSVAYGFNLQERAGQLKMLAKHELPYVAVPASHLNANLDKPLYSGLALIEEDPATLPKRLLLEYTNIGDGNDEAEAAGERTVGSDEAGERDTVVMRVRPVVGYYGQMKARADTLFNELLDEAVSTTTSLGPGYMDIMPGTVIGTVASNWDETEAATQSDTTVTFVNNGDISMPIVPGSVYISMNVIVDEGTDDEFVENVVVTDDGNGNLTGWPSFLYDASSTLPTIDTDASAGADIFNWTIPTPIVGTTAVIDDDYPVTMSYRVDRMLTMRASKVDFNGLDMTSELELVRQAYDGQANRANFGIGFNTFKPVPAPVPTSIGLIPIDVPAIYGGQGNSVKVGFASSDTDTRTVGAVLYESPNGEDQWTEVDQIVGSRPNGTLLNLDQLAVSFHTEDNPVHAFVDWSVEILLGMSDIYSFENATREEIAQGKNNLLIGDLSGGKQGEIIGFHEAELLTGANNPNEGTYWVIRGIVRGLHKTEYAAFTQYAASGVEFVDISDLGGTGSAYYTPTGGFTAGNATRYLRAVPPGQPIASVETQTFPFKGSSAMAPGPLLDVQQDTVSGDVTLSWTRRTFDQGPLFGMDTLPQGWYERYEVWAFDASPTAQATLGSFSDVHDWIEENAFANWVVGGQNQGGASTEREITYTSAQQYADGIRNFPAATSIVGFVVYQIGPTGRGHRSSPYVVENYTIATAVAP